MKQGGSYIPTGRERISVDFLHRFLSSEAFWPKGIARETVARSLDNSLCFVARRRPDRVRARPIGPRHHSLNLATFLYSPNIAGEDCPNGS